MAGRIEKKKAYLDLRCRHDLRFKQIDHSDIVSFFFISETCMDCVDETRLVVRGRTKEGEGGGGDEWTRDAIGRLKEIRWLARFFRRSGSARDRGRKSERKTSRTVSVRRRMGISFSRRIVEVKEGGARFSPTGRWRSPRSGREGIGRRQERRTRRLRYIHR